MQFTLLYIISRFHMQHINYYIDTKIIIVDRILNIYNTVG